MNMNPFLSVIIPVYNEEKYVVFAVKSILEQPCRDLEIILLNDGSKDNSASVCKKLAESDSRIKFADKENTGVSDTRNTGIDLSSGSFIAFLDSDDVWSKDVYTEKLKNDIIASKCDIVSFAYNCSYEDVNNVYQTTWPENPGTGHERQGDKNVDCIYTPFCTSWYSKELIIDKNVYFKKGKRMYEDELFKRSILYFAKKVYVVNKEVPPLFTYRNNPHSVCHTSAVRKDAYNYLDAFYELQEFYENCYVKENIDKNYYNAQQGLLFLRVLNMHCDIYSFDKWEKTFIDKNVLQTFKTEIENGLSVPNDTMMRINKVLSNPKKYYYKKKTELQLKNIRRHIYRFYSQKIRK